MSEPTDTEFEAARRYISDHAPVWEEQFDAGPGLVVGLTDAALLAAKYAAAERKKARAPFLALAAQYAMRSESMTNDPTNDPGWSRTLWIFAQNLRRAAEES